MLGVLQSPRNQVASEYLSEMILERLYSIF